MGQAESEPVIVDVAKAEAKAPENKFSKYLDVPEVDPLIQKKMLMNIFPPELNIPSGKLPAAHEIMKIYYHSLSQQMSQNQSAISYHIHEQLDHYVKVARNMAKRKKQLEVNLGKAMDEFEALDRDVKETCESLSMAMKKADMLAKSIASSSGRACDGNGCRIYRHCGLIRNASNDRGSGHESLGSYLTDTDVHWETSGTIRSTTAPRRESIASTDEIVWFCRFFVLIGIPIARTGVAPAFVRIPR